eukprot:09540.XXX_402181_399586_1 [CDS] Oithona nana genome sequencing.
MSDVRFRLVVMGDSYVGKSAIVKRFLTGKFNTNYAATVEDLYSQDFEIGEAGTCIKVDILDTAGDAQFPAMRRLSIASAHAFLLVYSVTDPLSFVTVKHRFEEIREQRPDFQDIPIVVAGNKVDVVREIEIEEVEDWVSSQLSKERTRVFDCSAAENLNIREIFKSFLALSKINFGAKLTGIIQSDSASTESSDSLSKAFQRPGAPTASDTCGLKRNLSAYGRLKSTSRKKQAEINKMEILDALEQEHRRKIGKQGSPGTSEISEGSTESPAMSPREIKVLGFNFNFSPFGSPKNGKNNGNVISPPAFEKMKSPKRSRSLIRRSSRKAKQQMQNVHSPDDCVVS